ncbi:GD14928 [Drosophila simulans]|uniref:GD14928 n=1 Tax=Drosophila simulans TaxID=7240 RepID=B4QJM3_DROSI|nr:GD14928 [Drosophila simulans]
MSEADLKNLSQNSDGDQELLLHQTTQSLLMASSMMFMENQGGPGASGGGVALPGPVSLPLPLSIAMPHHHVHAIPYNVDELLRENNALHAKIKELSLERDRLLCEVSNLRLELDMSELKRLPVDLDDK